VYSGHFVLRAGRVPSFESRRSGCDPGSAKRGVGRAHVEQPAHVPGRLKRPLRSSSRALTLPPATANGGVHEASRERPVNPTSCSACSIHSRASSFMPCAYCQARSLFNKASVLAIECLLDSIICVAIRLAMTTASNAINSAAPDCRRGWLSLFPQRVIFIAA